VPSGVQALSALLTSMYLVRVFGRGCDNGNKDHLTAARPLRKQTLHVRPGEHVEHLIVCCREHVRPNQLHNECQSSWCYLVERGRLPGALFTGASA